MTVLAPENDRRRQYIATGGQTVFAYDFFVAVATDLQVFQNSALINFPADYAVSNVGVVGGGDVTLTVGATLNDVISIEADTPQVRSTDFTTSNFKSAELNLQLDDLIRLSQEQERDIARSAILPVFVLDSVDVTLPVPEALKAITWNATADGFVNTVVPGSSNAIEGPDPAASTDNAIVRWDGTTGRLVDDSGVLIDDSNNITGVLSFTGAGTFIMDADGINTHTIGKAKIGEGSVSDTMTLAHFDHFGGSAFALRQQAGAGGVVNLNSPSSVLISIATNTIMSFTATSASTASGIDFNVSDGDLDVEGLIEAGTADTILTNADGTIIGSVVDSTLISSLATVTALSGDFVLIGDTSDSNNLKKVDALDFLAGAGDVTGPGATVTDEAVAVYDGTGGLTIKEVGVTMTVAGAVAAVTTLTGSGVLSMGSDADGTHILGRAKTGSIATDSAHWSHFDHFTATGYAIRQPANGNVTVNAGTGLTVGLAINDVVILAVTGSQTQIVSGDFDILLGDLDVEGVIEAGTADTVLTNADGTIIGTVIDSTVISGQTLVTSVGADSMLILDATDGALKKSLISDIAGGSGDVSRDGTNADNQLVRWHLTGADIQNTGILINDSDDISGIGDLAMTGDATITGVGSATTLMIIPSGTGTGGTANTSFDDIVIDASAGSRGISFLTGTNEQSGFMWGDTGSNNRASILYDSNGKDLKFATAESGAEVKFQAGTSDLNLILSGEAGLELGKFEGDCEITDFLRTPTGGALTVTTNTITPTASLHTYGGFGETINTITGTTAGDRFVIYRTSGSTATTVTDGGGNIKTTSGANITWNFNEGLYCIYDGTDWRVTHLN